MLLKVKNKQDGFTLVELSIVLVIIGLLIGGILAAQSMIETAKIQNIIRIIQQFDVAVNNFQTKYNGLPGDAKAFGGNGDGKIFDADGGYSQFTGEMANFWVGLQQGGFNYQNKVFTATVPASGFDIDSNTPNSPKISMNVDAGVIPIYHPPRGVDSNANHYQFSNYKSRHVEAVDNTTFYGGSGPVLKPALALSIDQKIDDGNPELGNVFNGNVDEGSGNTDYAGCDDDGISYTPDQSGINCFLTVKMLSQTGQ